MKNKKADDKNMNNFFNEMAYELAGDIGKVDNDDMKENHHLIGKEEIKNQNKKERPEV